MDRYIGRMLDNRYEILEVIGSGGMAVVYKARCHRLNRLVAIKILKDENLQDADFRRRFHAESQAVAMLSHPNIVSVYDVSMGSDEDYIVMELIEGISLKQYMEKKGVLNWKETLHFATQIAKALEHAHSKGLVHRDIKPHNVMVLKTGAVKVADFGIACMMTKTNTMTKEALGSVHYISPEQAKGGRVDNRSDIYSLGVVMYEMITGRTPYDGESPVSVAIQHIQGGAMKPSEINPAIPEALEQIIQKAMANHPSNRYADAAQMLHDLDEFRKNPAITVLPSAAAKAAAAVSDATGAMPPLQPQEKVEPELPEKKQSGHAVPPQPKQKPQEPAKSDRRSLITTLVVALCCLLIVAAIVVLLVMELGGKETPPEQKTVQIPDLIGMYYAGLPDDYEGVEIIVQSSVYSDDFSEGQIIRQEPQGGDEKPQGTRVFVTVSLGARPVEQVINMINLAGKTVEEAQQWLNDQPIHLNVKVAQEYSNTLPAGTVISTTPAEGAVLNAGDWVTLIVSEGKEMATMPDLVSHSTMLMHARTKMENYGFKNVEWIPVNSALPLNTVVSQSVQAGSEVSLDARIIICYSNGIAPNVKMVTMEVTLEGLPEMAANYRLSVVIDSRVVLVDHVVTAGETACTVTLTAAAGPAECQLYVNGVYYKTITVEFVADE